MADQEHADLHRVKLQAEIRKLTAESEKLEAEASDLARPPWQRPAAWILSGSAIVALLGAWLALPKDVLEKQKKINELEVQINTLKSEVQGYEARKRLDELDANLHSTSQELQSAQRTLAIETSELNTVQQQLTSAQQQKVSLDESLRKSLKDQLVFSLAALKGRSSIRPDEPAVQQALTALRSHRDDSGGLLQVLKKEIDTKDPDQKCLLLYLIMAGLGDTSVRPELLTLATTPAVLSEEEHRGRLCVPFLDHFRAAVLKTELFSDVERAILLRSLHEYLIARDENLPGKSKGYIRGTCNTVSVLRELSEWSVGANVEYRDVLRQHWQLYQPEFLESMDKVLLNGCDLPYEVCAVILLKEWTLHETDYAEHPRGLLLKGDFKVPQGVPLDCNANHRWKNTVEVNLTENATEVYPTKASSDKPFELIEQWVGRHASLVDAVSSPTGEKVFALPREKFAALLRNQWLEGLD